MSPWSYRLPLAPFNVGWQTHYLNLVYSPNKAVSFVIAAEAFRRLPRLKTYGRYPRNTPFGPFRISYEEDLSEMATEREFFYSNDTKTVLPAPEKLTRIVGCGSSPVVHYSGTGAYFLDKLSDGVWRLEVYSDAVWVNDPYGNPRLDRYVSVAFWREGFGEPPSSAGVRIPIAAAPSTPETADWVMIVKARTLHHQRLLWKSGWWSKMERLSALMCP